MQAKSQSKTRRPNGLKPPFDLSKLDARDDTYPILPPEPRHYPAAFQSQQVLTPLGRVGGVADTMAGLMPRQHRNIPTKQVTVKLKRKGLEDSRYLL